MSGLLKLFCVLVLTFSASVCFAVLTPEQIAERDKLRTSILRPMLTYFKDSVSPSGWLSNKITEQQKSGKQMSDEQLQALYDDPEYLELVRRGDAIRGGVPCPDDDKLGQFTTEQFVDLLIPMWNLKMAACGEFTDLATTIFEFYKMNKEKQGVPDTMFNEATILLTTRNMHGENMNGDHSALFIWGNSGVIFLVEPNEKRVLVLNSTMVPKAASDSLLAHYRKLPPVTVFDSIPDKFNEILNLQYKKNGLYDRIFVVEQTKWAFRVAYFKKIQQFAHTRDANMRRLYETLRPTFPDALPLDYDSLFSASGASGSTDMGSKPAATAEEKVPKKGD